MVHRMGTQVQVGRKTGIQPRRSLQQQMEEQHRHMRLDKRGRRHGQSKEERAHVSVAAQHSHAHPGVEPLQLQLKCRMV